MQNRRDLRACLRLFKAQCSRVQREIPPCCVETEPLTKLKARSSRSKRSIALLRSKRFGNS